MRPADIPVRSLVFSALLFFGGAFTFWLLRPWGIQSGDYEEYIEVKRYGWHQPIYHLREPGSVLLWQSMAWGARRIVDGDSSLRELEPDERRRGFSLMGAFSGGLFLVFLAAFLREAPPASAARGGLAAAVVLVSAITMTFIGHFEFYAPLYAGLMLFYWLLARYFQEPTPRKFAALVAGLVVAVTMHRAAVFQMPALALIWLRPGRPLRLSRPSQDQIVALLLGLIVVCSLHFGPVLWAMTPKSTILVYEDYNWLPELITPLTQGWADYVAENSKLGSYHLFTFGSRAHWEHFLFFVGIASPLGLPVVVALRKRVRGGLALILLGASICGWAWAFVWHPHLGFGDWDLFVNPGLPTNLLAAWLILKGSPAEGSGGARGPRDSIQPQRERP